MSRITGTVFVVKGTRDSGNSHRLNVGLNLKFNKANKEVWWLLYGRLSLADVIDAVCHQIDWLLVKYFSLWDKSILQNFLMKLTCTHRLQLQSSWLQSLITVALVTVSKNDRLVGTEFYIQTTLSLFRFPATRARTETTGHIQTRF